MPRLRQLSVIIGWWSLVLVGVAGLLLPILPGVVFLATGLAILASRYTWARRILELGCINKLTAGSWLARFCNHLRNARAEPESASLSRD
jgi:uncharacterized protein YqgC (DUF456 family)